jgi:hypothetical protein
MRRPGRGRCHAGGHCPAVEGRLPASRFRGRRNGRDRSTPTAVLSLFLRSPRRVPVRTTSRR